MDEEKPGDTAAPKTSDESPCNRIKVTELKSYITTNRRTIFEEFESLRCGYYTGKEVARRKENWMKNRYDTLIAYDHNRVILDVVDGDPSSDYINANYIDGYNHPRKFIAAQGPLQRTVDDFWRMIWQENTRRVVMVTGLVEGRTNKCEKYWPEKSQTYGNIKVRLMDIKQSSRYEIRTFQIAKDQKSRELVHFHYTDWMDQQVPDDHPAVAEFVQVFRAKRIQEEGPIVVHCSAGVARTGVIIMLDIMMDMALAEDAVDLLACLWTLRKQRYNAVAASEQYYFTYQILAEHLLNINASGK